MTPMTQSEMEKEYHNNKFIMKRSTTTTTMMSSTRSFKRRIDNCYNDHRPTSVIKLQKKENNDGQTNGIMNGMESLFGRLMNRTTNNKNEIIIQQQGKSPIISQRLTNMFQATGWYTNNNNNNNHHHQQEHIQNQKQHESNKSMQGIDTEEILLFESPRTLHDFDRIIHASPSIGKNKSKYRIDNDDDDKGDYYYYYDDDNESKYFLSQNDEDSMIDFGVPSWCDDETLLCSNTTSRHIQHQRQRRNSSTAHITIPTLLEIPTPAHQNNNIKATTSSLWYPWCASLESVDMGETTIYFDHYHHHKQQHVKKEILGSSTKDLPAAAPAPESTTSNNNHSTWPNWPLPSPSLLDMDETIYFGESDDDDDDDDGEEEEEEYKIDNDREDVVSRDDSTENTPFIIRPHEFGFNIYCSENAPCNQMSLSKAQAMVHFLHNQIDGTFLLYDENGIAHYLEDNYETVDAMDRIYKNFCAEQANDYKNNISLSQDKSRNNTTSETTIKPTTTTTSSTKPTIQSFRERISVPMHKMFSNKVAPAVTKMFTKQN